MRLEFTFRRYHKLDETAADCADHIVADDEHGVFAVADGVSSAIFAGAWSSRLCHAALDAVPDELSANGLADWLKPLRSKMSEHIAVQVEGKPWYVTEKARDGASSTLMLGQYARSETDWHLYVWNVGDCNLLWSSEDGHWDAWPMEAASGFDRLPPQLASIFSPVRGFQRKVLPVQTGDLVVVATDAVAKWLLGRLSEAEPDVRRGQLDSWIAEATPSDEAWQQWVTAQRATGMLENDDSSVLVVRHQGGTPGQPGLMALPAPEVPLEDYSTDTVTVIPLPPPVPEPISTGDTSPAPAAAADEGGTSLGEAANAGTFAALPSTQGEEPAASADLPNEREAGLDAAATAGRASTNEPASLEPDSVPTEARSADPGERPHSALQNAPATSNLGQRLDAWRTDIATAMLQPVDTLQPPWGVSRRIAESLRQIRSDQEAALQAARFVLECSRPAQVQLPKPAEGRRRQASGRVIPLGAPTLADMIDSFGFDAEAHLTRLLLDPNAARDRKEHQRMLVWQWLSRQDARIQAPPIDALAFTVLWVCWTAANA